MANVKKSMKKYADGGPVPPKKKAAPSKSSSKNNIGGSDDNANPSNYGPKGEWLNTLQSSPYRNSKNRFTLSPPPKSKASVTPAKKMKAGGSFPDLNKDGKITKADILKGRGVIAKKGAKVSKAMAGCKACWGSKMKKK